MGTPRDWLQLFRSHTSSLEMTITITGAALAVGTLWDVRVLLFLIFGWLYHNAGYGHNSVEDYLQGYDREDPNKAHHPLQRGAIDPRTARYVCITLVVLSFIYGIFISDFNLTAISLLAVITFMGALYNTAGKRMRGKFIPIAIAHSLLFPFAYFGSGGTLRMLADRPLLNSGAVPVALIVTAYLIVQIIYQIMIEGDLKDMDMDEASLLRSIGVGIDDGMFRASGIARSFSFLLKSTSVGLLFWVMFEGRGSLMIYFLLGLLCIAMLLIDDRLMRKRIFDHRGTLRDMALMEVVSTFALVLAVAPFMGGILPALLIMTFSFVYFILMNNYLWGTVMEPRV